MASDKNMKTIVRLYFGLGLSVALIAPASAELAMTGGPPSRCAPDRRQGKHRAAHPAKGGNRSGKMRPQLVSRVVARSIRLYPGGRSRAGASTPRPCRATRCRRRLSTLRPRISRRRRGNGPGPTLASTAVWDPDLGSAATLRASGAGLPISAAELICRRDPFPTEEMSA